MYEPAVALVAESPIEVRVVAVDEESASAGVALNLVGR